MCRTAIYVEVEVELMPVSSAFICVPTCSDAASLEAPPLSGNEGTLVMTSSCDFGRQQSRFVVKLKPKSPQKSQCIPPTIIDL